MDETEHRSKIRSGLIAALKRVHAFEGLDDRALLRIFGASSVFVWKAGDRVFEKGDPADGLYVVLSGAVRLLDAGPDGSDVEVKVCRAGTVFGELALFFGERRSLGVAAAEDTELMVIPLRPFNALLASDPDLAAYFERMFSEKAEALGRRPVA